MRISDWSSECALPISALQTPDGKPGLLARYYNPVTPPPAQFQPGAMAQQLAAIRYPDPPVVRRVEHAVGHRDLDPAKVAHHQRPVWTGRSEERRVGKECTDSCRWAQYHDTKNKKKKNAIT